MKQKTWRFTEEKILIDNYETCTIRELELLLPGRNNESINAKIKRMKRNGKLAGNRDEDARSRAFAQRHHGLEDQSYTEDPKKLSCEE